MAKLTLVIDDDLLHRARLRALAQGTSVNALVREMLANYAADERILASRRSVAALARASTAGSDSTGRRVGHAMRSIALALLEDQTVDQAGVWG